MEVTLILTLPDFYFLVTYNFILVSYVQITD